MNQYPDPTTLKYIIYCRKSTDSEDRQVLSLPAQVRELKDIADKHNLKVVDTFMESHSAFHPGRPLFEEVLKLIEAGKANALLVWANNRIARNSLDGGRVIYLMDLGKLLCIKTQGGVYYNTPDHKFALNIDFTIAKKSSDDLSEVVKRGNREKFLERREWVGLANPGYLNVNDPITKESHIAIDSDRFYKIKEAMEAVAHEVMTPIEALHYLNDKLEYKTRQTKCQTPKPILTSPR